MDVPRDGRLEVRSLGWAGFNLADAPLKWRVSEILIDGLVLPPMGVSPGVNGRRDLPVPGPLPCEMGVLVQRTAWLVCWEQAQGTCPAPTGTSHVMESLWIYPMWWKAASVHEARSTWPLW